MLDGLRRGFPVPSGACGALVCVLIHLVVVAPLAEACGESF